MNATVTLAPSASSPCSVPAPSATICPAFTFCPTWTSGRWLMAVSWLVRQNFFRRRSEEHTSELQSRLHLVCRLLLEKKKQNPLPRILVISQLVTIMIFYEYISRSHYPSTMC